MISLIVFIIIVVLLYKAFYKPNKGNSSNNNNGPYRIVLSDPLTGSKKYLANVDGIKRKFNYTENEENALVFKNLQYAKQILLALPTNINPRIESKGFLFWKEVNS